MKVLILGCQGQLGSELRNTFGHDAVPCDRKQVDIQSLDSITSQLDRSDAQVVINAAAYNLVDQAEDEPEIAYSVNALGPRNLALACVQRDLTLVHISSDYVFGLDGSNRPWLETDAPGPVSAYGASKLAGEHFVRSLVPQHFVLRTSGLYGHAARRGAGKGNFVETMLRLGAERSELRIVDDQFCTPTSVRDLAKAISELIVTSDYGLYHATNQGECTWAWFAEEIFRQVNLSTNVIRIPSSEYPTPAKRPKYSLLNCNKLHSVIATPLSDWKESLARYLRERDLPANSSD